MATAGERKNNPGCIMGKNGLRQYASLEEGYYALNSLLLRRYNNKTCYEIFKKYAPYSDGNNPRRYADFVINELRSKGINVNDSTKLDLSNPYVLQELTLAISKMENGKVLGGANFARNCASNFAAGKGLQPRQVLAANAEQIEPINSSDSPMEGLTPENLALLEEKKKQQQKADLEQSLAKQNAQKKQENSNLLQTLLCLTTSLLTGNSQIGNILTQVITNVSNDEQNQLAVNKNDNQNA